MSEKRMKTHQLICVTCKEPIDMTDEWSWLDGKCRQPEHDRCYADRFARRFPLAAKGPSEAGDEILMSERQE